MEINRMSETKFTKGEWDVLSIESDKEYIRIRGTAIGGRYKIANVTDLKLHHDGKEWCLREREESLANAHLIARAPNLYHALKSTTEELAFVIDSYNKKVKDPAHFIDAETCHLNQIELAKARGEKC